MKYLCLVYLEEKLLNDMSQNQRVAISDDAMAYCDKLQKQGQLLAASPAAPGGHRNDRAGPRWQYHD